MLGADDDFWLDDCARKHTKKKCCNFVLRFVVQLCKNFFPRKK